MYRTTHRIRKAGVAALVATLTVVSGLAFAPPASAAALTEANLLLSAPSGSTTIGLAAANQPAMPLRITSTGAATDTLATGDVITLTVADSGGANCTSSTDTIGFSAVPTVAVTGTATVTSAVGESASCLLLGAAAVNDVLTLTVSAGGTATAINITGITYTVGSTAALGAVQVNGSFDSVNPGPVGAFGTASNAAITSALLTANNPPKGSDDGTGSYAISPVVIAEQTTGTGEDFCLAFDTVVVTSTLTVASSVGTDTATATVQGNNVLVNTTGNASATTFTISGILLSRVDKGVQSATLWDDDDLDCTDGSPTALSFPTNVGGVTDVERFGGSTRFTTAQILFEHRFDCPTDVIIARADLYPDALASSYLAGHADTGILLTNTNDVPAATINALRNEGVDNVYLMGGTTAISAAVATQLDATTNYDCGGNPAVAPAATTLTVQRIGGADRYETAALVSTFPGLTVAGDLDFTPVTATDDNTDQQNTAIVALGENFPDALAAGPLAFDGDGGDPIPLLLTRQAAVPASTLGALGDLGIVNVIVTGGTVAVSDAAVAQLTAAGYTVRRIAGTTRQGTAVALATAMIKEWGFDDSDAAIAAGDNFPDSLTGGPWAGSDQNGERSGQVILLTGNATTLSTETAAFLAAWEGLFTHECGTEGELDDLDIFGGTVAVAASTVQAAVNATTLQRSGIVPCGM